MHLVKDEPWEDPWDDVCVTCGRRWVDKPHCAWQLDDLAADVGGPVVLAELHDRPLPDEQFRWDGIDAPVEAIVAEVLALCDEVSDVFLDVEYRTACRRLLAEVATRKPEWLERSTAAKSTGAVISAVGRFNRTFRSSVGGPQATDIAIHLGLRGAIGSRSDSLVRAAGYGYRYDRNRRSVLELLVSRRRAEIVAERDNLRAQVANIRVEHQLWLGRR